MKRGGKRRGGVGGRCSLSGMLGAECEEVDWWIEALEIEIGREKKTRIHYPTCSSGVRHKQESVKGDFSQRCRQ